MDPGYQPQAQSEGFRGTARSAVQGKTLTDHFWDDLLRANIVLSHNREVLLYWDRTPERLLVEDQVTVGSDTFSVQTMELGH